MLITVITLTSVITLTTVIMVTSVITLTTIIMGTMLITVTDILTMYPLQFQFQPQPQHLLLDLLRYHQEYIQVQFQGIMAMSNLKTGTVLMVQQQTSG